MSFHVQFWRILWVVAILCLSCKNTKKHHDADVENQHSINLLKGAAYVSHNFDDVFSWMRTIPLSFQDKTILGEVSKVIYVNDHFYVLDNKTYRLYEFDSSGHNTNSYGNVGQGPGEYVRIDDFLIDSVSQQLVILANEGRAAIYFYDLRTSEFIKKSHANIYPLRFSQYGNDFLIYTSKNPSEKGKFDVFRVNDDGKVLESFLPYKIDIPVISTQSGFLKRSTKDIYYAAQYSNQVYVFDDSLQSFLPYMHISINNPFIERNKDKPMEIFRSGAVLKDGTSFLMSSFDSNDNYTVLTFHRNKGMGIAIYKHADKEIIQILPQSLHKDIRYRIIDIFNPHTLSEDNKMIFVVDPARISKLKELRLNDTDLPIEVDRLLERTQAEAKDQHHLAIMQVVF